MTPRESVLELKKRVGETILGQEEMIERLLIGLLADGNLLVEGLPGLAKTRAIKKLSKFLDAGLSRIQFTPDLLPSDITGSEIYEEAHDASSAAPKPATRVPQDVIFAARREIHVVQMAAAVEQYIVDLIEASRYPERYDKELRKWIQIGASPRGTIGLDKCSRAYAWLQGRDYVRPDDVQAIAHDVLRHRLLLSYDAQAEGIKANAVIDKMIQLVAVA
jgi:MoxR-like ATPase